MRVKYVDNNPYYFTARTLPSVSHSQDFISVNQEETPQFQEIVNFIRLEVHKLLKARRLTEQTLLELDSKVAIEVYLRQKKEAILEDKKIKSGEHLFNQE